MTKLFLTIMLVGLILIVFISYLTYLGWQIGKDDDLKINSKLIVKNHHPASVRLIFFIFTFEIIVSLIWVILLIHS